MLQRKGHHHQRATIANFISPDNGVRGQMTRKGLTPKDHMKDNLRSIKETQYRNREQQEEAARPTKELYKLSQFKEVNSRVFDDVERKTSEVTERKDFLTKGVSDKRRNELRKEHKEIRAEVESKLEEARYYSAEKPSTPRKPSVPKANDLAELAPLTNTDHISRNRIKAVTSVPSRKDVKQEQGKHEEYGRVPDYLVERKAKWEIEQEERRRREPDPNCPPGMKLMSEDERLNTLETLKESKEEAMYQLRKLPFVIETPSMRKKQEFLEGKLREIDNALAIFSKSKVYIAIN